MTVTDGLFDLRVITTDNVGNTHTSSPVDSVRVDNTAPTVSVSLAGGASGASGNGSPVYFRATSAGTSPWWRR